MNKPVPSLIQCLCHYPATQESPGEGYFHPVLLKLAATFEHHRPTLPGIASLEQQCLAVFSNEASLYENSKRVLAALRTTRDHFPWGNSLYLRVLADIAQAHGKPFPRHRGAFYLEPVGLASTPQ